MVTAALYYDLFDICSISKWGQNYDMSCIPQNKLGSALTVVWSKALPLSARCLSPLPGFESWSGLVRNLPVT